MHLSIHKAIVYSLLRTVNETRDEYFYESIKFIHENIIQCLSRISPRFLISTSYPHYNWWEENTNRKTAIFVKEFFSGDFWTSSEMNEIDTYLTWQFVIDYLLFLIKEIDRQFGREILTGDPDKLDGMRLGLWPQRSELLGAAPRRNSFWENHLTPLCSLLIDDRIRSTSNLNIISASEFWTEQWEIYIRRNSIMINIARSPSRAPEINKSVRELQGIIDSLVRGETPTLKEGDYIKYSNSLKEWYISSD